MPSLVGRSGSVCVVERQKKSIYNAQQVDTEDILMPCHPRRDQLRFYRIHREGRCSRARVPCHRLVVRGDREVYRSLIFYDNCDAYISQFLEKRKTLSENGERHGAAPNPWPNSRVCGLTTDCYCNTGDVKGTKFVAEEQCRRADGGNFLCDPRN